MNSNSKERVIFRCDEISAFESFNVVERVRANSDFMALD